jgi:hypothetical protein
MQSKSARPMQKSVNRANLGLLEFRLAREVGAGQRRWNSSAMETAYNVYTLRQKHLEKGTKKTVKTQHKGDVSAKYKVAWADIAQMANVMVSEKDGQGI